MFLTYAVYMHENLSIMLLTYLLFLGAQLLLIIIDVTDSLTHLEFDKEAISDG